MNKILSTLLMIVLLASGCTYKDASFALKQDQIDDLMEQYSATFESAYEEYLPCQYVSSCEVFGVEFEKDANIGYVYAYVVNNEYLQLENTVYESSGGNYPAKIKIKMEDGKLTYLGCQYPEDSDGYEKSMEELFPEKYYKACSKYNPYDENEKLKLEQQQLEKIHNLWNCKVSDYQLHLTEDGAYEIVEATENENGEMTAKIIEKGFYK